MNIAKKIGRDAFAVQLAAADVLGTRDLLVERQGGDINRWQVVNDLDALHPFDLLEQDRSKAHAVGITFFHGEHPCVLGIVLLPNDSLDFGWATPVVVEARENRDIRFDLRDGVSTRTVRVLIHVRLFKVFACPVFPIFFSATPLAVGDGPFLFVDRKTEICQFRQERHVRFGDVEHELSTRVALHRSINCCPGQLGIVFGIGR